MKVKQIVGEVTITPLPGASAIVGDDGKTIGTAKDAAAATALKAMADKGEVTLGGGSDTPTQEGHGEHDTMASGHNDDVGGDATDDFISDVTDKEWEHDAAGREVGEAMFGFGNKSPEEWAQTSPQMAKLLAFRAKAKGTQYEQQVEQRIQLLKDRLDMDAGEVAGPGGAPKDPVAPEKFNPAQLREGRTARTTPKESTELTAMLRIAGLR